MAKSTTTQKIVAPSAENLVASVQAAQKGNPKGGLPPVHLWNPPHCGHIDMRIARDGTWFYMGTPIGRPALVKLFSTILRRDGDDYVLVTPVEKVGITVDDAPFVAVDVNRQGDDLAFETNVGDKVTAGPDNPIRVERDAETGEPSPYVLVRANLEALIDRKSFYRLVDMGQEGDHASARWFGVRSGGVFFPIIPADELP